jgi:hypothetical protein
MAKHQVKPNLSQAVRLKKLSQDGVLTAAEIDRIFSEEKKPDPRLRIAVTLPTTLVDVFPHDYSPPQMQEVVISLLTAWAASRERLEKAAS